ncbi:hypothetical protein ACFL4S_00210 [bacterium]
MTFSAFICISDIINNIRKIINPDELRKVYIGQIVEDALKLISEMKFKRNNIELIKNITSDTIPAYIRAVDLQQVIMNLVSNAIEAIIKKGEKKRRNNNRYECI